MIVLSDEGASVSLSPDFGWRWVDEFDWAPVQQSLTRTLTGAAIVQTGAMTGGQPITLGAGGSGSDRALVSMTDARQLAAWASVPGKTLTLSLRGATRTVVFRHQDKPALELVPVVEYADPELGDLYFAKIKLMEL